MSQFLCLLAAVACLCLQSQVNVEAYLSRTQIENAVREAKSIVNAAYKYSRTESLDHLRRNVVTPSEILRFTKQPKGLTRQAVRAADYMEHTIRLLKCNRKKRSINATDLISEDALKVISDLTGCFPRSRAPSCKSLLYLDMFRTAQSTCNNMKIPRLGSSNTPLTRWLPAEYQDDINLPKAWNDKLKINNHVLPLVRDVSNRIISTNNNEVESDPLYTHLVTYFGQWTDHDLTFTPHSPSIRSFSNGIDCEHSCERTEPCFPMKLPDDDHRRKSHKCMTFFRSAPACGSGNTGHIFGESTVRQQMNSLTAFIDAGQVYGSDDVNARFLRNMSSDEGLLKVNTEYSDNGRELLPFSRAGAERCANRVRITNVTNAKEVPCFLAGDERNTEHIALTSLHTLMLREHNRLVRGLAKLNPNWNGERLYQEARKIMGGYMQVITFRDYLLHIVGPDFIAKQLSTYPGYDENVDPSISNVFATAAYRFAHLMIQPVVFRLNEDYVEHPVYPTPLLHKTFFTPWRIVFEGGVDPVLRGMMGRKAKLSTQDHMMPVELTDRLFKFSEKMSMDLASLNLQRGRDHGLPGYNKWRKFCGLSQPKNLTELTAVMDNDDMATKLLELYGTPDNIDVWMGGIAEPFVTGGRVGPLFACLIATQFKRIRQGDRLWWENKGVFTEGQRESLRETSFARIICDNTGITEVPKKPFQYRKRGSGYTKCKDIPQFDLNPWKENASQGPRGPAGPKGPMGPRGFTGPRGPRGPPGQSSANVAFAVRLGSSFPKSGRPIVFNEVIYNGQKAYDTKKGVFTCDEPGVYEFQFHCTVSDKDASVDLLRNGKRILHSFTTHQKGFIIASGSIYVQLKEKDKVWMIVNNNGRGVTKNSYFFGHLLFTEK